MNIKKEINELLKELKIKSKHLEKIDIKNLIFTLENIETHYITFRGDIFYCYKCYEEEPKNEEDIKSFCDYDNLHRSLHSNDLNKRIKLEYGTEKSKIELLKYLKGKL